VGRKDFRPGGQTSVFGITLVAAFARSAECRKPMAESRWPIACGEAAMRGRMASGAPIVNRRKLERITGNPHANFCFVS